MSARAVRRPSAILRILIPLLSGTAASAQSGDVPSNPGHTTVGGAQFELLGMPKPDIELSLRGGYFDGTVEGGVIEPGVQFRVNRFLTLGPSYLHLFQAATAASPDPHGRRVRFSVNASAEIGSFLVKHRSLAEYRFRDGGGGWRYRPQLQIERGFDVGGRKVTPYVAAEPIYDFAQTRWTGNQTYAGLRVAAGRAIALSLFEYHLAQFRGADVDSVTLGWRYTLGR